MPTISGVWKWNDTVNLTMGILEFQISVTIDGTEYQTIFTSGTSIGGTPKDSSDNVYFNFNGGWVKSAYKVWDFGTSPQTIDQGLYTLITNNAQTYSAPAKAISLDNLQTFKNNCDTAYEPRKNIPTPTTANNGQVLGVTNGVYAFTQISPQKMYLHNICISYQTSSGSNRTSICFQLIVRDPASVVSITGINIIFRAYDITELMCSGYIFSTGTSAIPYRVYLKSTDSSTTRIYVDSRNTTNNGSIYTPYFEDGTEGITVTDNVYELK